MADITWAQVEKFAAAVSTVPIEVQTLVLEHVNTALKVDVFDGEDGPKTQLARIYMAAHMGTVWITISKSGATGIVTSESADGLSRSYDVSALTGAGGAGDALDSTTWGRMLRRMMRNSGARAPRILG